MYERIHVYFNGDFSLVTNTWAVEKRVFPTIFEEKLAVIRIAAQPLNCGILYSWRQEKYRIQLRVQPSTMRKAWIDCTGSTAVVVIELNVEM